MGTQISHKRRKFTDWGRCSYQQHSSENIFGRQRGEKSNGHQGQFTMVDEDVVKGRATPNSVPEPDGWSTRCWWPWRGSCEGARGHKETQVKAAAWEWGRSTWAAAGGGGNR